MTTALDVPLDEAAGSARTVDAGVANGTRESEASHALRATVGRLRSLTLEELNGRAPMLERTDRKYFVPMRVLDELVESLAADFDVLEIDERRVFQYESTYFDTADLLTYRSHRQGRRRRFKVRIRTYLDSDETQLEVKLKGRRGSTIKERMSYPLTGGVPSTLHGAARIFVEDRLADHYGTPIPGELAAVLTTTTRRATLVARAGEARLTCDVGVTSAHQGRGVTLRDDLVLVESKAGAAGCAVDGRLRGLGIRPVDVSKYCVGIAVLRPDLASNPWHRVLREHFNPTPVCAR